MILISLKKCVAIVTDEYEKEISIHTTATSKDGEKTILAGKEVAFRREFSYTVINHII